MYFLGFKKKLLQKIFLDDKNLKSKYLVNVSLNNSTVYNMDF